MSYFKGGTDNEGFSSKAGGLAREKKGWRGFG